MVDVYGKAPVPPGMELAGDLRTVQAMMEQGLNELSQAYIRPLHERPRPEEQQHELQEPKNKFPVSIPVIDWSGLDESASHHRETMELVDKACKEWGFFQLVNHGIPDSLLQRVRNMAQEFLNLPNEQKLVYSCKPELGFEGYGSRMSFNNNAVVDWRDWFLLFTQPKSARQYEFWPPSFREPLEEYGNEAYKLVLRLLEVFSENLGLVPSSSLSDEIGELHQNFVINHYPRCPQPDLALGLLPHSDLGGVTLLLQDDKVPGLQVKKKDSEEWLLLEPVPNAIVVNLADMMEVVTNGRYVSAFHRVIVNKDNPRTTIAMFHDPMPDKLVVPSPQLIDDAHPRKFRSLTFSQYRNEFVAKGTDAKKGLQSDS